MKPETDNTCCNTVVSTGFLRHVLLAHSLIWGTALANHGKPQWGCLCGFPLGVRQHIEFIYDSINSKFSKVTTLCKISIKSECGDLLIAKTQI